MKVLLALTTATALLFCVGFTAEARMSTARCVAKCEKYCNKYDPGGGENNRCLNKCQTRYQC